MTSSVEHPYLSTHYAYSEPGILSRLAQRVRLRVPSLVDLSSMLESGEYVAALNELVRKWLPEQAEEMLRMPIPDRLGTFCQRFSNRYFPLDDPDMFIEDISNGLQSFMSTLPIQVMGQDVEEYHDPTSIKDGWVLCMAFFEHPYVDEERTALLEHVKDLLKDDVKPLEDLLKMAPIGYSPVELEQRLKGTSFEPISLMANWYHQCTPFLQLNVNYEEYNNDLDWSDDWVTQLTEEWKEAQVYMGRIDKFVEQIELRPDIFGRVVKYLAGWPRPDKSLLPGKTLMEVFSEPGT